MLDVVIPVSVGLIPLALRLGPRNFQKTGRSSFGGGSTARFQTKSTENQRWDLAPAYFLVQGCPASSDRIAAFLIRDQAARRACMWSFKSWCKQHGAYGGAA